MPSMRPASLNPRARAAGAAEPSPRAPDPARPASAPASAATPLTRQTAIAEAAHEAVRAGGFHESSYELQHGLQITESEWPDDVTVPGALGER